MTPEVVALWFVAIEIALRDLDNYGLDEAAFYGWWEDDLLDPQDASTRTP